jgi:hypothetical protein
MEVAVHTTIEQTWPSQMSDHDSGISITEQVHEKPDRPGPMATQNAQCRGGSELKHVNPQLVKNKSRYCYCNYNDSLNSMVERTRCRTVSQVYRHSQRP